MRSTGATRRRLLLAGVITLGSVVSLRAQTIRYEWDGCVIEISHWSIQNNTAKKSEETPATRHDVERVQAALEGALRLSDDMKEKVKEACDNYESKVTISVFRDSPHTDQAEAFPGSITLDLGDIDAIGDNMTEGSDANLVRDIAAHALKRSLAHEFDHLRDDADDWETDHRDPLEDRSRMGEPVVDANRVISEIGGNHTRTAYGGNTIEYEGTGDLAETKATHLYMDQISETRTARGGSGFGSPLPLDGDDLQGLPDQPCGPGTGPDCYPSSGASSTPEVGTPDASLLNPSSVMGSPRADGIQLMLVILAPSSGPAGPDDTIVLDGLDEVPLGCPPGDGEKEAGRAGTRGERTPDYSGGRYDCAMISVANSLVYLAETFGIPRGTEEGQLERTGTEIIRSLRDAMQWVPGRGVTHESFLDGKNAYVAHYRLPIETTVIENPSVPQMEEALSDPKKAVEIDAMTRTPEGRWVGHTMTLVGAESASSGSSSILVHDAKGGGEKSTDRYETAEVRDVNGRELVGIDGYAEGSLTIVTRMYVQEYRGSEEGQREDRDEEGGGEGGDGTEDGSVEPAGNRGKALRPLSHDPIGDSAWGVSGRSAVDASLDLGRPSPEVLLVSTGLSTGPAFKAVMTQPGEIDFEGPWVAEPVQQTREDLVHAGPGQTLAGYCLQFDEEVPPEGTVYRLASAADQPRYASHHRLYRVARELQRRDGLHPDSDPEGYFHSILQWSIWTVEEGFDAEAFAAEFLEHMKGNVEAAGRRWTDDIEEVVRAVIPNRWNDIQRVIERASP